MCNEEGWRKRKEFFKRAKRISVRENKDCTKVYEIGEVAKICEQKMMRFLCFRFFLVSKITRT